MKKFTLLSAAVVAAMGMNAQTLIEWDENGQYTFYPENFIAEGSISWDEDEAAFVCDGTGEGRIMLNLDGKTIDFSEVANIVVNGGFLLPDADDVVPFGPGMWGPEDPLESLVITDAVNGQINAWAGSRYVPNLAANNNDGVPFYTLCAKVDGFYFTARTTKEGEGEDAVVTGSVPGQIFIDNMVLTKVMEQDPMAITGEMWHEWDSCTEANANIVGDFKGDVLLNTNLAGGAVFAGQMSGMVEGKLYADLSEYAGIYIKGTPGLLWRGLFNRVEMGDAGDYINVVCELNADGEYFLVFNKDERLKDAPFIHLNSVKLDWSSPEGRISKFNFIEKGSDPGAVNGINATKDANVIYNVFGQKVDESYRGIVIKNGKKFINK